MKKFDKRHIYYSMVSSLLSSFVVLFFFSDIVSDEDLLSKEKLLILVGIYAVAYIVQVVYAALFVQTSGYELTDTEIRCRKGVLARKTSVLTYGKVHAVNKKQSLIQRMFDIATLTVDSGATSNAFNAEITVIDRTQVIDLLTERIKRRQEGLPDEEVTAEVPPEKDNLYTFSSRLKMIYSGLSVVTSLFAIMVLAAVASVILGVATGFLRNVPDFSPSELWLGVLFISALALALTGILSLIGGIITSFVAYHDFRIHRNRDDLEITYGLFVRHTNNFKFRRIRAVKIMDGPIKRLFGFTTAGLEVVGYGAEGSGDSSEQNQSGAPGMLLPLCRAKELNETLTAILPGYVPDEIRHRAKSYRAFVLWPAAKILLAYLGAFLLILAVLLFFHVESRIILAVFAIDAASALVTVMIQAIVAAFQYENAGLTIGDGKVTVQNGALVRRKTVIRRKDIIGIERITTPMRMKKGICSYQIHFFTNAMTNTVTVQNLDASLGDALEEMLKN